MNLSTSRNTVTLALVCSSWLCLTGCDSSSTAGVPAASAALDGSGADAQADGSLRPLPDLAQTVDSTVVDDGHSDVQVGDVGPTDTPEVALPGFSGWGPQLCPSDTGNPAFAVGSPLAELPVQDCDTGEPRSLTEACGAAATWLFVAHSHCPTCVATAQYTAKVAADYAERNVAVVHIVHIDSGTTCPAWRKKYGLEGLPNVRVYADKSADAWAALKVSNSTAIHAFADGQRVITYKAHGLSSSQVGKQLDAALAK